MKGFVVLLAVCCLSLSGCTVAELSAVQGVLTNSPQLFHDLLTGGPVADRLMNIVLGSYILGAR